MRLNACLLTILSVATGFSAAQQPSARDQAAPAPDKDGVYRVAPGIDAPYFISPAMAAVPANAPATDGPRIVRLSAVIAADGSVANLEVLYPAGDAYEKAAADAVRQSKFAPGMVNGSPAPVLVCLRVPFIRVQPAIPRIVDCPGPNAPGPGGFAGSRMPPGTTPPRAVSVGNPEYSELARRKRIQGVVVLSTLVNERGEPTDIRVERGLGYGLDENAMRAVSQYRFRPAMDAAGKPVAVRIAVEVSFRLY